jgi:hypothetical protein
MTDYKKYEKRLGNLIKKEETNQLPQEKPVEDCLYYESTLKLCSHTNNETHRCTGVCPNYV